MNEFELSEALIDLSRSANKIAKLLVQGSLQNLLQQNIGSKSLNINDFVNWPDYSPPEPIYYTIPNIESLSILEYAYGSPITEGCKIDLITCGGYNFVDQPKNIRIILSHETNDNYDFGIIYESLEFSTDPIVILQIFKKCCKRIYIRFRPWTSQNGAFLNSKAFVHLVNDIDNSVIWKVIRPLATYESLFSKLNFIIIERKINHIQVPEFFNNDEILLTIQNRVWGEIDRSQMLKILTIDSVDYILER